MNTEGEPAPKPEDDPFRTSESLIIRLRTGQDQTAWIQFAAIYTPLLHRWASGFKLQSADVDDLVQSVLLVVVKQIPEFEYDRSGSFRSWLKTIAVNKAMEAFRRRKVRRETDPGGLSQLSDTDSAHAILELEHDHAVLMMALRVASEAFDAKTYRAACATIMDNRPPADVAKEFGMSVGAVYTARSRALARVRHIVHGIISDN